MKISFLLSASLLLSTTIGLSAAHAVNADSDRHTDKKRSVQLTPQWSLPFQGQLSATNVASLPLKAKIVTVASLVPTNPSLSTNNDLALLKSKQYSVLTIAPPAVSGNKLIASVSGINTDADTEADKETPPSAGSDKSIKLITGGVSAWDGPFDADRIINHLVDTHFENSPEGQKLDKQVKCQNNLAHKAIAITKDGLNNAIEYQGIDPSVRAGRLIVDSHDYKIRNNAWADYVRQKYIDQIHFQVVSSLMEIAEGIGNSETERGIKSIAAGKEALGALVGEEESGRTVKALTHWLNNMSVSYANFAQIPWTTMERSKKLEDVLKAAVERDPIITKVTQRVYKYAHPNKAFQYSSGVIQGSLDAIALFAPGIIPSVAAETVEIGYKLGTGGTELNKLERELLLDKRIQSRLKVLTQESELALDSYRYALITKNPPLLAFSEEVIGNLTGKSDAPKIVSAQSNSHPDTLVPEMIESTPEKDKHRVVKIPLVN